MRILTLDQATTTGWAFLAGGGLLEFGSYTVPASGHDLGRFADNYRRLLHAKLDRLNPDLVAFEPPFLGPRSSGPTLRRLMGIAMLTELICRDRNIACEEAEPRDVRVFFIGRNAARKTAKAMTIAECRALGLAVKNDDEADAVASLAYVAHCHGLGFCEPYKVRHAKGPLI